jgi:glycosyltransferase involved in cell wall biosynthesis
VRILLINETARPHTGGLNRMVVESIDWLRRAGHDVALGYFDRAPSAVPEPVFSLPPHGVELVEAARKMIQEFRPDVIQLHLAWPDFFLNEIHRFVPTCRFIHDQSWFCSGGDRMSGRYSACHRPHGVACLFWHYAQRCGGKNPIGNWRRWKQVERFQSLKRHRTVRIQVASQFMQQGLIENGYSESRIDVVPLFAIPARAKSNHDGLLLVASRLVKSKGVHVLLDALSRIAHLPWKLAIAGEGPERYKLESKAAGLGFQTRVQFLGELTPESLDLWYARAHIVVSPVLRPEPFGLIGLEAMAHGKPLIAFAGGATEEWLVHQKTGLVVRDRSATALAQAIATLIENAEASASFGSAAMEHWAQFRPEIYIERVTNSFRRAIHDFSAKV